MILNALRYTRKFNLGNYESEDITVEVVPDEGQSAEDVLAAAREFVCSRRTPNGGSVIQGSKPKSPDLPMKSSPAKSGKPAESKPAESKSAPAKPANGQKKKGRPSKALKAARDVVQEAIEADNLEDLLERFQAARQHASAMTLDEWESACSQIAATYRTINTSQPDADGETTQTFVQAFKAERTAIDERRLAGE